MNGFHTGHALYFLNAGRRALVGCGGDGFADTDLLNNPPVDVFEAHRLLHHSPLGSRVIKKKRRITDKTLQQAIMWRHRGGRANKATESRSKRNYFNPLK